MKIDDILNKLDQLYTQSFSLEEFDKSLQSTKEELVKINDQDGAKQIWIYQTIVKIHKLHQEAFNLLKNKEYYKGWCRLERIEITIGSIKKHFRYDENQYQLWQIEKSVRNLQVIFPYRLFISSELLKKKVECSVCGKIISIRNHCGHITGEIYSGEMCYRIVSECEVLGMSIVENPCNKYSVMFLPDEKTKKTKDHYNYDVVGYLFEHIESSYEQWDLEVYQKEITKDNYGRIGRNDNCTCGSGKKFKKCCMLKIGTKYPHYKFILNNPNNKILDTNAIKNGGDLKICFPK